MSKIIRFNALALAAVVTIASCSDAGRAERITAPETPDLATSTGPTLLECPTDQTKSVTGTIDLLGGTLELDGHKIVFPANAVLLPTEFTLTVPASNYMEIDVKAAGKDHFQFEKPVSMTISYTRCTRSNIDKNNLKIFYIDSGTKAILEDMGGVDDKTAKTVTTSTDHFTGYSIGG